MKWASPEGPAAQPPGQAPAPVAWKLGEEVAVAAQLLDILHLSEQVGLLRGARRGSLAAMSAGRRGPQHKATH
jgi:hypothetical protein